MKGRSWRLAPLRDIPSDEAVSPDAGVTEAERREARAELDTAKHPTFPDYPPPRPHWHAIRNHFGITAFGVAASEAAEGEALIWPHTEVQYGHEELYVVLQGRARFLFEEDGEVEVGVHDLLFVNPDVGRGAIALETPTVVFMIGGKPSQYEIPMWSNDWRPPAEWLTARRSRP